MEKGKKVAIIGLGKSGFESARFLHAKGFQLYVTDASSNPTLQTRADQLSKQGIDTEIGNHSLDKILSADWVLISPGISPQSHLYYQIKKTGKAIVSEIEVASWFCPTKKIIAVTGTSGKTTVTTLLFQIFQKAFGKAICCGNIGNPWIGELNHIDESTYVILEISSFQLMHCYNFRPAAGIILNLSPNHEDWHRDFDEYVAAKLRLFQAQQKGDYAVVRNEDKRRLFAQYPFKGQVILYDTVTHPNPNEQAVRQVADLFQIQKDITEDVLKNFQGIEHRLERVGVYDGITYINDSKCTTTASLEWALSKFEDQSLILIAGGKPKTNDFHLVNPLLQKKVREAILIGTARPYLKKAWSSACPISEAETMQAAIERAHSLARKGDSVLLSPACASFDMFDNYEHRGKVFKDTIRQIVQTQHV